MIFTSYSPVILTSISILIHIYVFQLITATGFSLSWNEILFYCNVYVLIGSVIKLMINWIMYSIYISSNFILFMYFTRNQYCLNSNYNIRSPSFVWNRSIWNHSHYWDNSQKAKQNLIVKVNSHQPTRPINWRVPGVTDVWIIWLILSVWYAISWLCCRADCYQSNLHWSQVEAKHRIMPIWSPWHCHSLSLILAKITNYYRKTSNISSTPVGDEIVDNSDVVGSSPVDAAPTTSSFAT